MSTPKTPDNATSPKRNVPQGASLGGRKRGGVRVRRRSG
jgi:hypothetical protein